MTFADGPLFKAAPTYTQTLTGVVNPPSTFYVTFGQKYAREPHPVLGMLPCLPNHYLVVEGTDETIREIVTLTLGTAWSSIYSVFTFDPGYFPAGPLPCSC